MCFQGGRGQPDAGQDGAEHGDGGGEQHGLRRPRLRPGPVLRLVIS